MEDIVTRIIQYFTDLGEAGFDREASSGNGCYYVRLYDDSFDATGFDTLDEAIEELRYVTE